MDLIGQSMLATGLAITGLSGLSLVWFIGVLSLLGLWQGASAVHLALAYEYRERHIFLWLFLGFILTLPLGIWLIGVWAIFPISLGVIAYFIVTVRDTLEEMQRPRSFWDL